MTGLLPPTLNGQPLAHHGASPVFAVPGDGSANRGQIFDPTARLVRSPADVIHSILRNLQMAHDAAAHASANWSDSGLLAAAAQHDGAAGAYAQAMALIRLEAASLLTVTP